ncbi:MAG: hypothetical protein HKN47_11055, partial [Pirellulaceae bacterium]|nr:hypothetical protein [Pirellulaceae bacterium]
VITLPGLGEIDDSDILQFTQTSIGTDTAGTFSLFLDGSDVALTTGGENVDAISFAPDGRLVISVNGSTSVDATGGGVLSAVDEDLLVFNDVSFGENSAGTFQLFLDGSDFGLTNNSEDIYAASIVTNNGDVYFSTIGNYSATGLSGDNDDVLRLGFNTNMMDQFFDGDVSAFADENIDGLTVNVGPPTAAANSPSQRSAVQNPAMSEDVNADGAVTSMDTLLVINQLADDAAAQGDMMSAELSQLPQYFTDVNGDGQTSPADLLQIINFLQNQYLQDLSLTAHGEVVIASVPPDSPDPTALPSSLGLPTTPLRNSRFTDQTTNPSSTGSDPLLPLQMTTDVLRSADPNDDHWLDLLADDVSRLWRPAIQR